MGTRPPFQQGGEDAQFSAHVYCVQMAAWIKMPLGTELGRGLDDIVLHGDPAPLPNFRPMPIVAKGLDGSRWHVAWRLALVQATLC